jgi:hypothetical protein
MPDCQALFNGAPTLNYRCGGSTGIGKKGLGSEGRGPAITLVLRPESFFTLPVSRLSQAEDLGTGTWNLVAANIESASDCLDSNPGASRAPENRRATVNFSCCAAITATGLTKSG